MSSDKHFCPLCHHEDYEHWKFPDDARDYLHCDLCHLISTPKSTHPQFQTAKARYLHHLADSGSTGHINHLMKAIQPIQNFLKKEMDILDYGCGPKPVLSDLLRTWECSCQNYDLIFFPEPFIFKSYDAVFCIETAEHFSDPQKELTNINNVLKPGGYVIIMTALYSNKQHFSKWYYKRDFTHISFFHQKTMEFISKKMNWQQIFADAGATTVFKRLS